MDKLKNNHWNEDDLPKSGQLRISSLFRPKKRIGGLDAVQQSEVTNIDLEAGPSSKFIKQEFVVSSSSSDVNSDRSPLVASENDHLLKETKVKSLDSKVNYRDKRIKKEFEGISSSSSAMNHERSHLVSSEMNDIKQGTRKLSKMDLKKLAKLKFNVWLPDELVTDPVLRRNAKLYRPKNRISELYLLQKSMFAATAPNNFSGGFLRCKSEGESSSRPSEETLAIKSEDGKKGKRKHKSKKESRSLLVIKKKKTSAFVYGLNVLYKVCTEWDISPDMRREAASMYTYIKTTKKFTKLTFAAISACACLLIVLRKHYHEWSMRKFIEYLGCERAHFHSAFIEARKKLMMKEQFEHFFKRDNAVNKLN